MSKNKRKEATKSESVTSKPVKAAAPVSASVKPVPAGLEQTTTDSDVVNFNLQPYLVPLAIIVNALIIALAIFIAGRSGSSSSGSNVAGITTTPTTAAAADPNEQAATTTIADSPYEGDKSTAKIAIVEFSDYECPYCKQNFTTTEADVIKNYVDTGKAIYVYRNFIAVTAHNPAATTEIYAALCVRELSGNSDATYFKYHDLLYTNTGSNGSGIQNSQSVYTLAATLGVNQDQLKTCIDSGKYASILSRDEQAATSAGAQGTPGFVVGVLGSDGTVTGKLIAGAYPYSEFQKIADQEYAQAN
jgi:protein-disulfide isomerase